MDFSEIKVWLEMGKYFPILNNFFLIGKMFPYFWLIKIKNDFRILIIQVLRVSQIFFVCYTVLQCILRNQI